MRLIRDLSLPSAHALLLPLQAAQAILQYTPAVVNVNVDITLRSHAPHVYFYLKLGPDAPLDFFVEMAHRVVQYVSRPTLTELYSDPVAHSFANGMFAGMPLLRDCRVYDVDKKSVQVIFDSSEFCNKYANNHKTLLPGILFIFSVSHVLTRYVLLLRCARPQL